MIGGFCVWYGLKALIFGNKFGLSFVPFDFERARNLCANLYETFQIMYGMLHALYPTMGEERGCPVLTCQGKPLIRLLFPTPRPLPGAKMLR